MKYNVAFPRYYILNQEIITDDRCVDAFRYKRKNKSHDNVLVLVLIAKYLRRMHDDFPSSDIVESISCIQEN